MNVLTACSGIGAPEHAWRDLAFNFIGCSEIEPFPSAVLKHHYPTVKNYGDMTKYRDWNLNAADVDILFAGTPCQSFSVAGLRQGLDSPNGNLALVYLGMVEQFNPNWVVWENVPGVLSSSGGRDFGSFLGALGELGFGYAYRTLDSAGFGIPQRRRRVFLVGHISDWRRAAAVLFERESLSGDIAQGKRKKQTNTAEIGSSSEAAVYENHATDSRIKEVDVCPTITRRWGTGGNNVPLVQSVHFNQQCETRLSNTAFTLGSRWSGHPGQGHNSVILENQTVRRLIPSEAEQLMGFEKGYSDIEFKGKPAPDSQRYKALGNSMAVPVVRWLGKRLLEVEKTNL